MNGAPPDSGEGALTDIFRAAPAVPPGLAGLDGTE